MNKILDSMLFASRIIKNSKNIETECQKRNFTLGNSAAKKFEVFRIVLDALGFAVFYKIYNNPYVIEFIKKGLNSLTDTKTIEVFVFILLMLINILSTITITTICIFLFCVFYYFYKRQYP